MWFQMPLCTNSLCKGLVRSVLAQYLQDNALMPVLLSIGISLWPGPSLSPGSLLKRQSPLEVPEALRLWPPHQSC